MGEGGVWQAAREVMSVLELREPNCNDLRGARERIAEAVGPGGVLLWDEAQYLVQQNPKGRDNVDAFEWLRFAAEAGEFSLVFVGDLMLDGVVSDLPQLRRRLRRPVVIRRVSKADVRIFALARGLDDPRIIDAVAAVAAAHGGLGDVANMIAHARDCADGAAVDLAHVLYAIEDLKLAPIAAREYRYVSPTLLVEPGTSWIMALRSVALVHHPALRLTALAHEEVAPVLLSEPRPAPDLPAPDLPAPAPAVPDMPPAAPDALLERLAGALGLSPEALAEEGVAVIRQMQAALRRLVGAQAGEVATAAELARIAAPDPARFVPVEAVADVACGALAERMRHAEERTAAKVDRALRDGQLTPAMRDWAVALCRADEASFDTFLARSGAPFAHLFRPAVPAGPPPSSGGHSYSEGSAADLVAQQLGLKPGALG